MNNDPESESEIESELEFEYENDPEPEENVEDLFYITLVNRNQFESELYDFLVNPMALIPQDSSFWDPVVVSLNEYQIEQIENIEKEADCFICTNNFSNFKQVPCCSKLICEDCTEIWFCKSVKCPYCKQDLREFI